MEALKCTDLTIGYDTKTVLSAINLSLASGERAVLIGANGSGKSTMLRTMAGLEKPLAGSVEICGATFDGMSRRELSRMRAIVSTWRQGGGALTVEEAVSVGLNNSISLFGRISDEDRETVLKSISDVGISDLAGRYLATLSDGERQKTMIARALVQNTPVIFLDEPTAFLDVAARIEIMELLKNLACQGKTIVVSTHDIAPAVARADSLIVIDKKNKALCFGKTRQIIESKALDRAFAGSGVKFDASILDYR